MSQFDPDLLKVLVCPQTKAELVHHEGSLVSTDQASRCAYSIVDGIPDLLIAHARTLDLSEWQRIMTVAGVQTK